MLRSGERTHAERSGADAQSHVHGRMGDRPPRVGVNQDDLEALVAGCRRVLERLPTDEPT